VEDPMQITFVQLPFVVPMILKKLKWMKFIMKNIYKNIHGSLEAQVEFKPKEFFNANIVAFSIDISCANEMEHNDIESINAIIFKPCMFEDRKKKQSRTERT
jgi:hypothetical protein